MKPAQVLVLYVIIIH